MSTQELHVVGPEGYKRIVDPTRTEFYALVEGDQTAGAYDLVRIVQPAGPAEVPLHIHHHHEEAFYILSGEAEIQVGEARRFMKPGEFCVMPRGVSHTYRTVGDEELVALCLLSPGGHFKMFEEFVEAQPEPGPPDLEKLMPIMARHGLEVVGPPMRD